MPDPRVIVFTGAARVEPYLVFHRIAREASGAPVAGLLYAASQPKPLAPRVP